jgi:hypothetical protein
VKVSYPTLEQAELARSNLNNHEFQGTNIKTKPVKVLSRTHTPYTSKPSI